MASLKLNQDEDLQTYGTYLASVRRLKSSSKWTFSSLLPPLRFQLCYKRDGTKYLKQSFWLVCSILSIFSLIHLPQLLMQKNSLAFFICSLSSTYPTNQKALFIIYSKATPFHLFFPNTFTIVYPRATQ